MHGIDAPLTVPPTCNVIQIELHRHLEGSVHVDTVLDLARQHGVKLPNGPLGELTDPALCTEAGVAPHMQTTAPYPDLNTLLAVFDHTQSVLCDSDALYRVAREAVLAAAAEGIVALELR